MKKSNSSSVPSTPPYNFNVIFRRYWWLFPAVLAALFMRWYLHRNDPERLVSLSSEKLLAVRGEKAILLRQEAVYVVESQPIFGGKPFELLRLPNTSLGYAVRGNKLFYVQPKSSPLYAGDFKSISISSKISPEPFLLAALSDVRDYKLLLNNDLAFWIRESMEPKKLGVNGLSGASPSRFDLMSIPQTGGKTGCILRGMNDVDTFSGAALGVFWFKSSSKPYSLHYWREGVERVYPDFDAMETSLFDTPNRLYWVQKSQAAKTLLELHARYGGPMPPDLGTLTSVKLDGTDRQAMTGVNLNENGFAYQLATYRDRLYLWKRPLDFQPNSGASIEECGLWRLRNETSSEFERLFTPPQGAGKVFCFDGNYFYFVREEPQTSFFGWGDNLPNIHTLYRFRLPN